MKKFIIGLLTGGVAVAVIVWLSIPGLMLNVYPSKFDFEQTVTAIEQVYKKNNGRVPRVDDIQKNLASHGYANMTRVKILSVCQPGDAYKILNEDANKRVTAVMPCRIGVYEAKDGRTYVSVMNVGLMGKLFGGTISEAMDGVAEKEHTILRGIVEG